MESQPERSEGRVLAQALHDIAITLPAGWCVVVERTGQMAIFPGKPAKRDANSIVYDLELEERLIDR